MATVANSVEERVKDIVSIRLGVNRQLLKRETSFRDDLGADSIDMVELVMELEEEFDLTIPEDDTNLIRSVGEAVDYVEREQSKR
jgi:acyl carrier protein